MSLFKCGRPYANRFTVYFCPKSKSKLSTVNVIITSVFFLIDVRIKCPSSLLPTVTVKTEATSITVRWTKPAVDGGSPITAYRVLILRGSTKIENKNITDMSVKHQDFGSLNKSTNYTVKLLARNYVFEGKATERKIQTKYEGMKICTKSAYELYSVS